ncbi:Metabotropic glutamate receptor-like protein D, partial [Hondaea fermentalgiana]
MLLETEVLKEIQCAHVPLGSSGEAIILALASIAWLVLLICLVCVVAFRKHAALRSAQIKTLNVLLLGAALMNGAETSQIGEPTRVKCAMRFSLLLFGFMYFVGSLLIKQYTITMVLRRTRYDRRKGSRGQLFMRFEFTICTLVALAFFVIWYAVVGFEPEAVVADV